MSLRLFTVTEANALLPEVRPLVERMVRERGALTAAFERQERLVARIGGNGAALGSQELAAAQAEIQAAAAEIAKCLEAIHALGAVVKDVDVGLVDFPALRDGEEVLLCWRLGEDEIRFWHGAEEGFGGRQELPF